MSAAVPAGMRAGSPPPATKCISSIRFGSTRLPVEQARAASAAQPDYPLASAVVKPGDARSLPHVAGSADAVLLMGPLYHLPEREQRLAALGARRTVC